MSDSAYLGNRSPLQAGAFIRLPVGAVRPAGWLADQLNVQAEGLSGHLDEFWGSVKSTETAWLGGSGEAWERGPYYMDGLVPLAYLTGRAELIAKAQTWCDYQLAHQRADGHLGPATLDDWWPYAVVGKVLAQYAEASGDARVAPALLRFCRYQLLALDARPLKKDWAMTRASDQMWWVLWLYNRTGEAWLVELVRKLAAQGYDWTDHWTNFRYKAKTANHFGQETHVVNNAMGIKSPGVWWLLTGRPADRQAAYDALANLAEFHGQVAGIFSGDEHLAGRAPTQGTELCAVVEEMFSLEVLLAAFGEPAWADLLERIAYNALPATFTADMWAHQYDQQANQVLCSVARRQWTNNSETSNLFGLEPNYGCCTANMHQGWPKLLQHLWMATPAGGLAAVAYGPCEVKAEVAGGANVKLAVNTDYPFEGKVVIEVAPDRPAKFEMLLRIPAWADGASVRINGQPGPACEAGKFVRIVRLWQAGDKVALDLPMSVHVERRWRGAASILRGPLVFSLKIGEDFRRVAGQDPAPDYAVHPTTPWNYGLLLDDANPQATVETQVMAPEGPRPFDPAAAPVVLRAKGRRLSGWTLQDDQAGPTPESPARSDEPLEELTLIPYGSSHLRVSEFPTLAE